MALNHEGLLEVGVVFLPGDYSNNIIESSLEICQLKSTALNIYHKIRSHPISEQNPVQ